MHIDFTPEQAALRQEIRSYYKKLFTPELRKALDHEYVEMGGPVWRQIVRQMGQDGWLGIGWPKEYGGQNRTPLEQFIFWDETYRARAPLPVISVNTIGPTLMQFGTDTQKRELLPKILKGEISFAIGYTEPQSGTDLATLSTRAELDGDEWVINGSKVFTTHAHDADYIWLAARTDPNEKRHKGISMFLVPTTSKGFSCTPIYTVGYERTNATYYENVRIPKENLIGGLNQGWSLMTSQLNHERITLACPGRADFLLEQVWAYAAKTKGSDGRIILEEPWVQIKLAELYAKLEALKVLNWRSAWSLTNHTPQMAEASAVKVFGTEFFVDCYKTLLEIVGCAGLIKEGEPGAIFGGFLEHAYRGATTLTFGGGVNEVQRDIIAMAGLLLPRARR